MCGFVSWVEKDGGLFYLTDKEIFSERGKELEFVHNDALGHGAIRAYWGISGGIDHEVSRFWEKKLVPEEIYKKIADFDEHWGRALRAGYFTRDSLCWTVLGAPPRWKEKAWRQLLAQGPSNNDFVCIIRDAPEKWKEKAWSQLLAQGPCNNDLVWIICGAPEKWKEKAWRQLLAQIPCSNDLACIIRYAPEKWKKKATEQLLTRL